MVSRLGVSRCMVFVVDANGFQSGAPINSTEIGGLTAMHIACELGFVGVVDKLIMGGGACDRPNLIGWVRQDQ